MRKHGRFKPSCYGITVLHSALYKVHWFSPLCISNFFSRQVSGRGFAIVSAAHGRSGPRIRRLHHSFPFRAVGGDIHHNSNGLGGRRPRGPLVWIRPE